MLFFMGMAYEHMNDDKMTLRYIQKAINKNPSRPDYKVKKVSVLLRLQLMDEAEATVDQLLLNDPELYDGYCMKRVLLLEKKNYEEVVRFAKAATERFPEDADLLFDYAKAVALAGKNDSAIQILEWAKRLKSMKIPKSSFFFLKLKFKLKGGIWIRQLKPELRTVYKKEEK